MARPKTPRRSPAATRIPKGLPDRETLLKFVRDSGETDKAAIARAFGLKGEDQARASRFRRGWSAAGGGRRRRG
jgi:ribonuclease R